jgi:hypothetical protein
LAQRAQRKLADVQPHPTTQVRANTNAGPEKRGGDAAARPGSPFYPRVQRAVEPRDADYQGGFSFPQGAYELRAGQGLGHDYGQTGRQWREHSHHERVDVMERQRQQDTVVLGYQIGAE